MSARPKAAEPVPGPARAPARLRGTLAVGRTSKPGANLFGDDRPSHAEPRFRPRRPLPGVWRVGHPSPCRSGAERATQHLHPRTPHSRSASIDMLHNQGRPRLGTWRLPDCGLQNEGEAGKLSRRAAGSRPRRVLKTSSASARHHDHVAERGRTAGGPPPAWVHAERTRGKG